MLDANPGMMVHLSIDAAWEHNFNLGPAQGHEIRTSSNGIDILVDLNTAARANGLSLDVEENFGGSSLTINNPNMPPPVKNLDVTQLDAMRKAGEALHLIDVRTERSEGCPASAARAASCGGAWRAVP